MKEASSMIACFGDSITAGIPGVSYLRFLQTKRYKNFGIGGDTLSGLSGRVHNFIRENSCNEYIIEIGANDILLPFLSNYSKTWNKTVKRIIARGSIPLSNINDFKSEYEKLICMLSDKKVIIISVPCLGENTKSGLNLKVDEYNQCIKNLCQKYDIAYINFNSWQKEVIETKIAGSSYFISKNNYNVLIDSVITTYLGLSEWISKKRKLMVTVDGIHLNKTGAEGLANLIARISYGF